MNGKFLLRHAQIIGRGHLLAGKNSQDAINFGVVGFQGKEYFFGLVCDGCSEGTDSEVGAKLASSYMGRQIEMLLKSRVLAEKIPYLLHRRVVGFLKDTLGKISFDSQVSRVNFIKNNMLFTVLGFILTDRQCVIFAQGDGVYVVNDRVIARDENNMPRYIGYSLVDRRFLSRGASLVPDNFDIYTYPVDEVSRLAIATDGLSEEPGFVSELWGHKFPIGLQRRVNVWSLMEHKFQDDLSIVTLERV